MKRLSALTLPLLREKLRYVGLSVMSGQRKADLVSALHEHYHRVATHMDPARPHWVIAFDVGIKNLGYAVARVEHVNASKVVNMNKGAGAGLLSSSRKRSSSNREVKEDIGMSDTIASTSSNVLNSKVTLHQWGLAQPMIETSYNPAIMASNLNKLFDKILDDISLSQNKLHHIDNNNEHAVKSNNIPNLEISKLVSSPFRRGTLTHSSTSNEYNHHEVLKEGDVTVLVERQSWRFQSAQAMAIVRCAAVEAILVTLGVDRCGAINTVCLNPKNVGDLFGIGVDGNGKGNNEDGDDDEGVAQQLELEKSGSGKLKRTRSVASKKTAAKKLVDELLRGGDGPSALIRDLRLELDVPVTLQEKFYAEKKRDDLSDALLMALAYSTWRMRSFEEAPKVVGHT
ncbi:hypothetical protein HDU76_004831 [Blyttiomyces sp. JEL0837]|nr:hypothetical protein HDU76_004831 [Blyttiomyces sp. JEL0837]